MSDKLKKYILCHWYNSLRIFGKIVDFYTEIWYNNIEVRIIADIK